MYLFHERPDRRTVLATEVDVADTLRAKVVGLMGRSTLPDSYAMYFGFDSARTRGVHMVFVRTPIDVVWLLGGEVQRVETLDAWTGHGRARADAFVELSPGAAADVAVGDALTLEERT